MEGVALLAVIFLVLFVVGELITYQLWWVIGIAGALIIFYFVCALYEEAHRNEWIRDNAAKRQENNGKRRIKEEQTWFVEEADRLDEIVRRAGEDIRRLDE